MYFVVTTTINIPVLLKDYVADFNAFNHDYLIVVVGDLKTPSEVRDYCQRLKNVIYLDVNDQKKLFGELAIYEHIPFNSIQRRNFGYLYCIKEGIKKSDILITIDDDNYLKDNDYLGAHNRYPDLTALKYETQNKTWFNPLELFYAIEPPIYPRGFSILERHKNDLIEPINAKSLIAVNAGLWENDPDVDALSRLSGLFNDCKVTRTEPLILGTNVWCPFNSQNTAYLNGFWLTAYLCPYLGRFDDIFGSYITKKIADRLGYAVSFGSPVVKQNRNNHNIFNDFLLEIHGMAFTDKFVSFLSELKIKSSDILACYSEIAQCLKNNFENYAFNYGGHPHAKGKWDSAEMAYGMELWLDALNSLKVS